MIGWNFPSNNYGQVSGYSDAGIETFKGTPYESLAREIIQNSLDAKRDDTNQPVEVRFEIHNLPISELPSHQALTGIIMKCQEYWRKDGKVQNFTKRALEILSQPHVPLLKISDFQTTGLMGSEQEHSGKWHELIKSVGVSNKDSVSGGSFGIGKHAPFACSELRTVFYGTRDKNGCTAFQGVAKLVTHLNAYEETTQGTGYFGLIDRNKPILSMSEVPPFFHRDEIGTDVFIPGFLVQEHWEQTIVASVLNNFFVAIWESRLVVQVGNTKIASDTLETLVAKYSKDAAKTPLFVHYYQALSAPERQSFAMDDVEGLGRAELFILSGKNLPKRVAMIRSTGMKIFDKDRFRTPLPFVGVMLAKGIELNSCLREMEPPAHDKWEPDRSQNRSRAKKVLKTLNGWITETVRVISQRDEVEEMDVEGISQFLPDDYYDGPVSGQEEKEGEKGAPKLVELKKITRHKTDAYAAEAEIAATVSDEGDDRGTDQEPPNNRNKKDSDPSDQGGGSSDNQDKGKTNPEQPSTGEQQEDSSNQRTKRKRPRSLKGMRSFCTNPNSGLYNISYVPDRDGEGYLKIYIVGEDGKDDAPINAALVKETGESIPIQKGGIIGPLQFTGGIKNTLHVVLADSLRCALEVTLHADSN